MFKLKNPINCIVAQQDSGILILHAGEWGFLRDKHTKKQRIENNDTVSGWESPISVYIYSTTFHNEVPVMIKSPAKARNINANQ